MRFTVAGTALAALALAAPSYAQRYGESTWTRHGSTWTAALDSNGNPISPSLASPKAVWTETRTRYGANGRTTIEVGYDNDDDPVATSTLGHSSRSSSRAPTSTSVLPSSSTRSAKYFTTFFPLDQLMSISGYWPPRTSIIASPTYSSGSILSVSEIPGYDGNTAGLPTSTASNGRPVYGGTNVKRALPTADVAERGPPGRRLIP